MPPPPPYSHVHPQTRPCLPRSVAASVGYGADRQVQMVMDDVSLQLLAYHMPSPSTPAFVLQHVSATAEAGSVLAVMGPSGAGQLACLGALSGESGLPNIAKMVAGQVRAC